MLQSVFPVSGAPPTNTGTAATLIGTLLGQITGLVMAIAMFFLCYLTIINIHRVSESAQILTSAMTSMAAVRIGFAAIMMFPLSSGFSVGQAGVMQVAGWGIGMARTLYANAVKAIGPDAMVIADPVIPGTRTIVLGLIEDELCRSLINQATGSTLVPAPTATIVNSGKGAVVTYPYSLAAGNGTGSATCGSVSVADSSAGAATLGGVTIDMADQQRSILKGIVGTLRPQIDSIAQSYWQNKTQASLQPLLGLYQSATQSYTQQLTSAAQAITAQLRSNLSSTDARNGNLGLSKNEVQLSTLGWTSAAAYYLGFARLNGLTLSLASGTPTVNHAELRGPVAFPAGRHRAALHLLELVPRQAQDLCFNRRWPDLARRQRRHADRHSHGHGRRRHDGKAVPGAELYPDPAAELRQQSLPDRPELGRSVRRPDRAWQSDGPRRHDGARPRRHRLDHHGNGRHHLVQCAHDELGGRRRARSASASSCNSSRRRSSSAAWRC